MLWLITVFNIVFNDDSESGLFIFALFAYLKLLLKKKITTFVRFADYYFNIHLRLHIFLIKLYRDSCYMYLKFFYI